MNLPENFNDLPEDVRKDMIKSFQLYFGETCAETYCRSIWEWDYVGMEEILVENDQFIRDFVKEHLKDDRDMV